MILLFLAYLAFLNSSTPTPPSQTSNKHQQPIRIVVASYGDLVIVHGGFVSFVGGD
jgi:hypothetical protein